MSNATIVYQTNQTVPEGCVVSDVSTMGFIPWDNPENIISQETEKVVDTVVGAICLPVLFLISVPCNLLNMLVFWTQGLKERINLCLFYLSFVDFVYMLNSFLLNFERIRLPFSITVEFGPVMEFIVDHGLIGVVRGFTWISGCVSMLIASERCLCVVSPLRSQTFLKTTTTAAVLSLATVLILTGAVMIGLRWSLICVWDPATNTTSTAIYTSSFYKQNKAHMDVLTFFVTTIQPFFYVIVVTATTIVTSVKLKKMMAWRKQTSSLTLSSREVALTRMLIAVSILYVICSVPSIITGLCVMFVPGIGFSGHYYNFSNFMVSMMELASFINATFNFFVYSFLGSRFRETLWKLRSCKNMMSASKDFTTKWSINKFSLQ